LEEDEDEDMNRMAKELSVVWMVRDTMPARDYHGPSWKDSVFKLTLAQLIKYLGKAGLRVWNRDNTTLYDDQASAEKDAKGRIDKWEHRFDLGNVLRR